MTRVRAAVLGIVLLSATAPSGAQIPTLEQLRSTPLPGPAPSIVVQSPPPSFPSIEGAGALPPLGESPSAWDALRETEEELRRREEDLSRVRMRLDDAASDLEQTQAYLREVDEAREALRREVLRRIVLLDRIGRGGLARLVLTSRDPGEARFRSRLLRRLVREDAALASRYAALQAEAQTVRAELDRKLESQRALEQRLEERRQELQEELNRHRALVGTLESPDALPRLGAEARAEVIGLADALGMDASTTETDASALARSSIAVPASFPVAGDDVRGGLRMDVPAGLPVSAPADGHVAFAGTLAGYGLSVLIRTADGRGVLLGHLASLDVSEGEPLEAGTVVGETSASYSPLLPSLLVDVIGTETRLL